VPLNVPDEELINLCMCYGQSQGWVTRERLTNNKDRGKIGSNRTVDVLLNEGAAFENYFSLEGPLPGDQGRRVTVTHQGQPQQCSNCFSYDIPKYGMALSGRCPAQGNGHACKMMGTPRARMNHYMKDLEKLVGFTTLKMKHARFSGNRIATYDVNDDEEIVEDLVYKTPVGEKDERISTLEKEKRRVADRVTSSERKVDKVSKAARCGKEGEGPDREQGLQGNEDHRAQGGRGHQVRLHLLDRKPPATVPPSFAPRKG
jgi:hypothetical protein